MTNLKIKIFLSFHIFLLFFNDFNKKLENDKNNEKIDNIIFLNPYLLLNYPNKDLTRFEYFNISNITYNYSLKYKSIKIEYKVGFFDDNKMIINPSFLALYNNLHILCELKIINNNIIIYSLPNIYQNKYFTCIEFFSIRERVKLGIKIYIKGKMEYNYFYLFSERRINFRNLKYKNNYLFDPLVINKNITFLFEKIYNKKVNETLKFKKSYVKYPYFTDKKNSVFDENKWNYKNIYNNYFCLCKGEKCLNSNINQKCKYYFYLTIIEGNRYVYNKTDYLFVDFIFAELSSDDVYPIFETMVEQNIPSYYLTENSKIYYKYCYQKSECFRIIFVNEKDWAIPLVFLKLNLSPYLVHKSQ
jgi:hypothetical protein